MKSMAWIAALLFVAARADAVSLGQIDDFEDGTTADWTEGVPSPNPPVNVPDGGPLGDGDAWLQNVSSGGSGPGSSLVMFNFEQWAGDYLAAGVSAIEADLANFGAEPLYMRIAFEGEGGTQYGSTDAFVLPADGAWHHVRFDLLAVAVIAGSDTLEDVLASVTTLRILSAEDGPGWAGDRIVATLGVDNIQAVAAVPAPAALWLLIGALAGLGFRRRR